MLLLITFLVFIFTLPTPVLAVESHPLRPFPGQSAETTDQSFLTPYCAQRPTALEPNTFDKRDQQITLKVQGDLTSDFSEFVTPLLSITDPDKPDSNLPFEQQAKRYLADYLEGRAYYEAEPEIKEPNLFERQDIFARSGVFRKLASQTYQDKLKRTLIKRGAGDYKSLDELEELYGFKPSSLKVNPKTPVNNLTLGDFYNQWAPIPEDFDTIKEYETAYQAWTGCDQDGKNCSQWYDLWPYVPMFTREDAVGQIVTYDEPGQTSSPKTVTDVYHPHLARTYEVSNSLSFMLSPLSSHQSAQDPLLPSKWITPAPWNQDPFWLDSGQNLPPDSGTVCDPKDTLVFSSGDLALDNKVNTAVHKTETIDNPQYDPDCAVWVETPTGGYWDDSNCFFTIPVRFSPTSFKTRTPFLAEIIDRLLTGKSALFNIFRSEAEIKNNPPKNWPGVGFEAEENPNYTFSAGSAEAGNQKPGNTAKYFYKYLGFVHCQKEKLISRLLPPNTYIPYSLNCKNLDSLKPSPSTPPSGEINCNQNAQAQTPPGALNKEALLVLANNWKPGGYPHVIECYNDVVSRAQAAGVNPIFALLIWLNESGASNYDAFDYSIEDFGIHKTNNDPAVPEANDFSGQIDFFLGLPSAYASTCGKSDMETFTARFLGGSCTPTQATRDYLEGLKTKWNWVAPGVPFLTYP